MSDSSKLYLVDGAMGHTGLFLVRALLEEDKNCKIVATDLPIDSRKKLMTKETIFKDIENILEASDNPRVEFIPADFTKPDTLEELFKDKKYDVIYHPASLFDYFARLDILRKINVEGTTNLLKIICETQDLNRLRFIHWSTCGVYGEPKYKYDKKTKFVIPVDETALYDPHNSYCISKMEQELVIKDFEKNKGLKATIIRPGPMYGPHQIYGVYNVFLILKAMGHGIVILIHPKKYRLVMPTIHIEDLARAAIFLSKKEEAIGEAYNGLDDLVWMDEWMEWVYQQLGMRYSTLPVWFPLFRAIAKFSAWFRLKREKKAIKLGMRPLIDAAMIKYITRQYAFSNKKLKDLGFKFKYNVWTGCKQTIDWYIEHGWLPTEQNKMVLY